MPTHSRTPAPDARREGFALAAAILGLVIVAAIVTGGFYVASQETQISRSFNAADKALYFAEQGIAEVVGKRKRNEFEALAQDTFIQWAGDTVDAASGVTGSYITEVRRMDDRLFLVRSTGSVLYGDDIGATRRVGLLVRTFDMDLPADRAMQIYGGLTISGNAEIDGEDQYPTEWQNCDTTGVNTGIVAKDSSQINRDGNAHEISGDPPIDQDSTLEDSDFTDLGDTSFDELAAQASKVYASGESVTNTAPAYLSDGETCDPAPRSNWGAPLSPTDDCHTYFPIIYGEGDLSISSSSNGQGILLVEGNLTISGGFEFYGIIIVRGAVHTSGTGGHLNGIVMVRNGGELETNSTTGNSIVNFSSCAIERAENYNDRVARAVPLADRSWIDYSAADLSF